MDIFD